LLLFERAARCEAGRAAILACISSFRHQHSLRGLSEAEGHRHFSCCIIIAGCAVLADFEGWRRDDSHLYFALAGDSRHGFTRSGLPAFITACPHKPPKASTGKKTVDFTHVFSFVVGSGLAS
jgi:hypothetical protein